jgi:hypothetical protein
VSNFIPPCEWCESVLVVVLILVYSKLLTLGKYKSTSGSQRIIFCFRNMKDKKIIWHDMPCNKDIDNLYYKLLSFMQTGENQITKLALKVKEAKFFELFLFCCEKTSNNEKKILFYFLCSCWKILMIFTKRAVLNKNGKKGWQNSSGSRGNKLFWKMVFCLT